MSTSFFDDFNAGDLFEQTLNGYVAIEQSKRAQNANGTEHTAKKLENERPSGAAVQTHAPTAQATASAPQAGNIQLLPGFAVNKTLATGGGLLLLAALVYKAVK